MSAQDTKALQLLFQRPLEPVFTSRDNGKTSFDVPESFFTERYSGVAVELQSRFGDDIDTKIPLRDVTKPDLSFTKGLGKKQQFSLFNDKHKKIASQMIQLFMDAPDVSTLTALAAYTMDRVNPILFQYAYSVAVEHRPDTKAVSIPPIAEQFPKSFVEPSIFNDARAEGALISNSNRMHIEIPPNFTATDREEEQRLAYFREDIGVNSHHWHWHLVYPTTGPPAVVNKDRRGELFYYMHHQILARYNNERFCNQLGKLKPLNNLREPIPEGYFPKILSSVNNRTYPARATNVKLQDINRDDNQIEISEVQRWADRIHQAIDQGFVTDSRGQNIPLDPVKGIDILGNLIEASDLTVNRQLYGNIHNMGHNLICLSHDPENRHLEDFGVMGDVSTAMRDPIFYRWHGYIDTIFNKYKTLLPAYSDNELNCNNVVVDSVKAQLLAHKNAKPNILVTYWQKSDVDLAAGLDFGPNGNIYAHFQHLAHAPFEYTIMVTNGGATPRMGTCRIFLCPKADERGTPLKFNEQRDLAIEMDKFTVNLNPGQNILKRRSDESSVTIPYERSYRQLGAAYQPTDADALSKFQFCGCGWPQHLLLPKGSAAGFKFDLFVMISEYNDDAVEQTGPAGNDSCGDSYSFCGLRDKLYPDKRSMGYPFDRKSVADSLDVFVNAFKNMKKQEISIKFSNSVVEKK